MTNQKKRLGFKSIREEHLNDLAAWTNIENEDNYHVLEWDSNLDFRTDKILGESGIDKNQYIMRKKYNLLKLLN